MNFDQSPFASYEPFQQIPPQSYPMNGATNYPPPLDQLLSLGKLGSDWLDYQQLGITAEHIPDLIRMSVDEDLNQAHAEDKQVWAPVHAWRALGRLGASQAVVPLLNLLNDYPNDDWAHDELLSVFVMFGAVVLPELIRFFNDPDRDLFARLVVIRAMTDLAMAETSHRDEVVAVLFRALSALEENDKAFNGFVIGALRDLRAVEATPLIEEAFAKNQVDINIIGDWEDVQIALGLLAMRKTPRPIMPWPPIHEDVAPTKRPTAPKAKKPDNKAKRKAARASRKKNRRK
ncbi:MAG: DUF1186 domain-containing protein [Desulfobulbaceae bacterium]|jgi:hypothetical protein|nr:DUF1186 domain-containing protein [Desulfobulbaceae bacterium]